MRDGSLVLHMVRAGQSEHVGRVLEVWCVEVNAWCSWCREEFSPIEGCPAPVDPDESRFCSSSCAESASEAETAYEEARYTGAPVY